MTQKSALETELKLRIPATAPLASRLAAQGFRETIPAQPEQSILWDRGGALRTQGSALRTRRYAGRNRLTWKGPKVPDALLKIRPELETGVESGDALEAILRALGFEPVLRMEKVRAVWEGAGLEEGADADGRLDAAVLAVAGCGYAEVERASHAGLIPAVNQASVGFDHHLRVRGLHREDHLVEAV